MAPTQPSPSAVVTGASTGIGRATALHLDSRGLRVFASVRRPEDAESLRSEGSERLTPMIFDVVDAAAVEAAAKTVDNALGPDGLGGLVNNAGIPIGGPLEFIDLDELRRQLEINVVGLVSVTQSFLPMLRRGRGRVVNLSSIGGYLSGPFLGPYNASKFAVEALSDALRRELRPWGIDCSVVEPGSIATAIWEKGLDYSKSMRGTLPKRALDLYGDTLDAFDQYAVTTSRRGIPPEKVARKIHHALTAARPRTRYRVGIDAHLTRWLSRVLPDRALDAVLPRLMGLPRHRTTQEES